MMYKGKILKKDEDKIDDIKLFRVIYHYWKYLKNYKLGLLTTTILGGLGDGLFMVGTPYLSKHLIDALNNNADWQQIQGLFFGIIGIFIVSSALRRIALHLEIKYDVNCLNDLIKYTFREISNREMAFFENEFVGALVNKMQKFAVAFSTLKVGIFDDLIGTIVRVVVSVVVIFFVDYRIGIIFVIWFSIYSIITFFLLKKKIKLDYKKAKTVSKRLGISADVVTNILNLKIFSAQRREINYHNRAVDTSRDAVLRSWHWSNFSEIVTAVQFLVLEFVALGWALVLWSRGELTVGDIVMIQAYFALFLASLWSIDGLFRRLAQAISDAKEMVEILDQENTVKDIRGAKRMKVEKGDIIFQDTTFSYPNQKTEIFSKFNLKVINGQTVGLVGTSGAGKTTITKLLLRFSNLNSGKILIDNQDISKVTQDSLRSNIAYVPQEPVLFHRSIYENVSYGNSKATKKEIMEASKKAHVDEFVQTLEGGYDTMVGERGVKLSGGQRQRIAIARAFLKNAPILVLDEATSALDSVSEELIQDALLELMKRKTVIVVAHRLSTIQRLDRILVIEEGEIKEDGSHQKLLQQNGFYKKFWDKQTSRFSG